MAWPIHTFVWKCLIRVVTIVNTLAAALFANVVGSVARDAQFGLNLGTSSQPIAFLVVLDIGLVLEYKHFFFMIIADRVNRGRRRWLQGYRWRIGRNS